MERESESDLRAGNRSFVNARPPFWTRATGPCLLVVGNARIDAILEHAVVGHGGTTNERPPNGTCRIERILQVASIVIHKAIFFSIAPHLSGNAHLASGIGRQIDDG